MCKLLFPPPVTVLGVLTPALYLPDTELCIFLLPVLPETKHESLPLTTQEKESREEVGRGICREERMDAPDYLSICPTLSLCAAQLLLQCGEVCLQGSKTWERPSPPLLL